MESKILQNAAIETENSIWGREGTQETLPDSKLLSEPQRKTVRKFQAVAPSQGELTVHPLQLHTQEFIEHSLAALPSCVRQAKGVGVTN